MASYFGTERRQGSGGTSLLYDPRARGIFYQVVVFGAVIAGIYWIVGNTITNLQRANIASGFGFLYGRAGFDISQTLIQYNSDSTYGRAFLVGLVNTLYVAALGIVTASIIGFLVGIGRLSHNWLIRNISTVYVEVFRNIPPLLVIFFWYFGVLSVLPRCAKAIPCRFPPISTIAASSCHRRFGARGMGLAGGAFDWHPGFVCRCALGKTPPDGNRTAFPHDTRIGCTDYRPADTGADRDGLSGFIRRAQAWNLQSDGRRADQAGISGPVSGLVLLYGLLHCRNRSCRCSGCQQGQTEAAYAVGLRSGQTMRLIIVPQALRIIIPPLSSQYLNLIKNSSLAIAIGYPDLVAVGGTILNQTGQAVEVVAIWMVIYLGISLIVSGLMNWFNAKMALVER